jgi:hypothetical protein
MQGNISRYRAWRTRFALILTELGGEKYIIKKNMSSSQMCLIKKLIVDGSGPPLPQNQFSGCFSMKKAGKIVFFWNDEYEY